MYSILRKSSRKKGHFCENPEKVQQFCVISVSEKSGGGKLSPESSWLVLYEMAKNYKIDLLFRAWIKEAKKSVYIKIFQES